MCFFIILILHYSAGWRNWNEFPYICMKNFASLAQLVEQLIRNEQVVGSSPIGGSKKILQKNCGSSSGVEHQLPKLRVEGSNPFSRSKYKRSTHMSYSVNMPPIMATIITLSLIH